MLMGRGIGGSEEMLGREEGDIGGMRGSRGLEFVGD